MAARAAEVVIINCSTRELTALALVSALRHGGLPVTVIDCESTDGSVDYLEALQRELPFEIAHMPLRRHGVTLDRLFRTTTRDALLLLDSDAEILDPRLVPAMRDALRPGVYGSGFLHAGEWLAASHGGGEGKGWYAERMWIPCVLLDVAAVREAMDAGFSFRQRVVGNELPQWPWLATMLRLRFRIPGLRALALDGMGASRREYGGVNPHYVYRDTGADVHDYLVNRNGLLFADLGREWWATAVAHRHGVTRRQLRPWMRNAAEVDSSRADAIERITKDYGVKLPEG